MHHSLVLRSLVAVIGVLFFGIMLYMQSLPPRRRRAFAKGIASVSNPSWITEEDEPLLDRLVRNHIVLYSAAGSLFILWAISGIGFD